MPGTSDWATRCERSGGWKRCAGNCSGCPSLTVAVGEVDQHHLTLENRLRGNGEDQLGVDRQVDKKHLKVIASSAAHQREGSGDCGWPEEKPGGYRYEYKRVCFLVTVQ